MSITGSKHRPIRDEGDPLAVEITAIGMGTDSAERFADARAAAGEDLVSFVSALLDANPDDHVEHYVVERAALLPRIFEIVDLVAAGEVKLTLVISDHGDLLVEHTENGILTLTLQGVFASA